MTNGKKANKLVSKLTRTVQRSTYRELKKRAGDLANEIDSQLSGKLILTSQEKKIKEKAGLLQELIKEQEKGKKIDSKPGLNEESEQIKNELDKIQDQLASEQISHINTKAQMIILREEAEQRQKEAEEEKRKSEVNLATERERIAQLEEELEMARAEH